MIRCLLFSIPNIDKQCSMSGYRMIRHDQSITELRDAGQVTVTSRDPPSVFQQLRTGNTNQVYLHNIPTLLLFNIIYGRKICPSMNLW